MASRRKYSRPDRVLGLADPDRPPVQAALQILDRELAGMTDWLADQDDPGQAAQAILCFGDLIRALVAGLPERHDGPVRIRGH